MTPDLEPKHFKQILHKIKYQSYSIEIRLILQYQVNTLLKKDVGSFVLSMKGQITVLLQLKGTLKSTVYLKYSISRHLAYIVK